MPRYRNLVLAVFLLLALPTIAAPTKATDEPLLARFVRIIKHLVPGSLDLTDISFPRP
jgi:hypothetical protein